MLWVNTSLPQKNLVYTIPKIFETLEVIYKEKVKQLVVSASAVP